MLRLGNANSESNVGYPTNVNLKATPKIETEPPRCKCLLDAIKVDGLQALAQRGIGGLEYPLIRETPYVHHPNFKHGLLRAR